MIFQHKDTKNIKETKSNSLYSSCLCVEILLMKIQVLFFGATADAVGEREIEIDLENEAKAEDAFRQIVRNFPQLQKHSLLFAVNQEYSEGSEILRNGDELAIFTAVSGG